MCSQLTAITVQYILAEIIDSLRTKGASPQVVATIIADVMDKGPESNDRVQHVIAELRSGLADQLIAGMLGYT